MPGPTQLDRWRALHDALSPDIFSDLLDLPQAAVPDLLSGHAPPTGAVRARLEYFTDLQGRLDPPSAQRLSRWLTLRRFALNHHTPLELLRGAWTPLDAHARAIHDIAEADAYLSGL